MCNEQQNEWPFACVCVCVDSVNSVKGFKAVYVNVCTDLMCKGLQEYR